MNIETLVNFLGTRNIKNETKLILQRAQLSFRLFVTLRIMDAQQRRGEKSVDY